jgi:hypothetical protein
MLHMGGVPWNYSGWSRCRLPLSRYRYLLFLFGQRDLQLGRPREALDVFDRALNVASTVA